MILYDNGLFTLHTRRTTYQMKVDEFRVLEHIYYGARVSGGDLSYLIRRADRGFSPNPSEAGHERTYSLDTLPQEYSTCGVGDFRLPSLELELPNGSQLSDLRYQGYEIREGKYALPGLPAFHGEGGETLVVRLMDEAAGVEVELYYGVFERHDLITRAARVVNRGDETIAVLRAASMCLDFPRADLDLVTFDGRHAMEREFHRAPLRSGVQSVGSVRGTSSHQHNPFVMLCERGADEDYGLCYGAALLYSGNFEAAAELSQFGDTRLLMGIHPHHFRFELAPGEAFVAPEAALVCSPDGFAQLSVCFHRAMKENLLRFVPGEKPVLVNSWEATYFDFDAEKLVEIARASAPLGINLFVLDDGWFGKRDSDLSGLGDWQVNERKLPGGLTALVPRIEALGMRFGIWIEPEMVSEDSDLYREHPDWALVARGRACTRGRSQLVLDFSRREVREHVYAQIAKVLRSTHVSYVKWDMNRSLTDVFSAALPASRQGEVYHRYVLGVYEMLEWMRRDFPDMLIEGCSGGGGRFDAGMLYYTPQIWCSDNTDAVDRLRIQYGTSFAYPPCTMGAHVSAVPNEQTGRVTPLHTRGVVAMSGTFGYELDMTRLPGEEREAVRRQVETYKAHAGLIEGGDYYRLSSPYGEEGYTAWAHVSPERDEALVCAVSGTTQAARPFMTLRMRGLDPERSYRVSGDERLYPGDVLMRAGYPLSFPNGDYGAVQLFLKAE